MRRVQEEMFTETFEVGEQVIEVASDGRTVWVNNPLCVARFCPVSREFQPSAEQFWCIQHEDMKPTLDDWQHFVDHVRISFGVEVGPRHVPLYLRG